MNLFIISQLFMKLCGSYVIGISLDWVNIFLPGFSVDRGNQVTRLIEPSKTKFSTLGNARFTVTHFEIFDINK